MLPLKREFETLICCKLVQFLIGLGMVPVERLTPSRRMLLFASKLGSRPTKSVPSRSRRWSRAKLLKPSGTVPVKEFSARAIESNIRALPMLSGNLLMRALL